MPSNFFAWTVNAGKQSACSWYRITVPFSSLSALDYLNVYEDNGNNPEESNFAAMYSDINHFYAINGEEPLHRIRSIRRRKPGHRDGHDLFPPAIIYDTDDNNDFVHPFNMTYVRQGVRAYPDGRLLEPGEVLNFRDHKGKEEILWIDGETRYEGEIFNIARNLHTMKTRHAIIREAHGVTVSTKPLATYMREVIGHKNVYVFPNTISLSHYEKIRAVRTDPRVRILWQGGMTHLIDWYPLRAAVAHVARKYPNTTWVIYGEYFDWINEIIPRDQIEFHPWTPYEAYKLKRGLLNIDINLCPLVNNAFNVCKSAIKWYEGAIFNEPTLASRSPVFDEIVDGETGLLYSTPDEFVQKLSLLIENAELRARLGEGGHRWVLDNRTPEKTIPGLFDFYAETRARQKADLGKPIVKPATLEEVKKLTTSMR